MLVISRGYMVFPICISGGEAVSPWTYGDGWRWSSKSLRARWSQRSCCLPDARQKLPKSPTRFASWHRRKSTELMMLSHVYVHIFFVTKSWPDINDINIFKKDPRCWLHAWSGCGGCSPPDPAHLAQVWSIFIRLKQYFFLILDAVLAAKGEDTLL